MQPINSTTIKKQRHQGVWEGSNNFSRGWLVKWLHNIDCFSKIKGRDTTDWLVGPEMKWVMRMNESAKAKCHKYSCLPPRYHTYVRKSVT